MTPFSAQLRRDLLLAARRPAEAANPLLFFLFCTVLLGVGAAAEGEALVGYGGVWVLALFANMLAAEGLFERDREDGTLELMLIHARPRFAAVLGKLLAHWLMSGLPMVALSPVAAWLFLGSLADAPPLMASLLLGTPALTLIGAVGAALTVGAGRGGLLLAVLVTPLQLPVLIFGVGAATAGPFALYALAALLAASITLAPLAIARALAISQDY